jgi:hypothetical protein
MPTDPDNYNADIREYFEMADSTNINIFHNPLALHFRIPNVFCFDLCHARQEIVSLTKRGRSN